MAAIGLLPQDGGIDGSHGIHRTLILSRNRSSTRNTIESLKNVRRLASPVRLSLRLNVNVHDSESGLINMTPSNHPRHLRNALLRNACTVSRVICRWLDRPSHTAVATCQILTSFVSLSLPIFLCVIVAAVSAFGQAPEETAGPKSLFGLKNVIDVHLSMVPEEWEKMQPPKGARMDFLSIMLAFEDVVNDANEGGHFRNENSRRPGLAGYMGIDHQYGRADVTIDGETIRGVGLRYKGNGTFIEGQAIKRLSFKIDFNKYDEELEFRGLTKINLNNCVTDPSMLREALSYELFREAGIPCSRVGFARVNATVPGKFERKLLGLCSVVEQVDKRFLKDRYGSSEGLLLKPSTFGVFRYFDEDWAEYERAYVPKTEPKVEQQERVIEFAKLLHQADNETFDQQVDDHLDVDQFLRFLAVNVLLSNLDSFLGATQNHYIYLEPNSNKFQILPWDMDHSFGAFPLAGTPKSRRDLSIDHPGDRKNTLIERVLDVPRHKKTYHDYLDTYLDTIFAEEKVHQQITGAADFLRPLISANGADAPARFEKVVADAPSGGEPHAMKYFVGKRRESVRRQLDGLSSGQIVFSAEMVKFPVRKIIGFTIALMCMAVLNFYGWLWGIVAGFRGSVRWGFLNLLFYPIAPAVYGFGIRTELGRRSAIWAVFCTTCVVAWIVAAFATFS